MGSRLEANSDAVRKRIASHTFDDEEGDEYGGSVFGGFSDYFRRKKLKLQNLDAEIRSQSADRPSIFRGVVAHVNGYTQPSLNDLHVLIVQHGGGFLQYLDGKTTVTHIIASNLTPKKAVEFRRYRIVKPAWVVDSIAAGKLLPWTDYRVLDEGENQKVLAFGDGKVVSEQNKKPRGYKDQTESSWYTNQLRGQPSDTLQGTPSSVMRARFSRPSLPSPGHRIQGPAPSNQLQLVSSDNDVLEPKRSGVVPSATMITPPKTNPFLGPEKDLAPDAESDSLHASPVSLQTVEPKDIPRRDSADGAQSLPRALTAEDHNAILLRDPKIRKSTVVDPNILDQDRKITRLNSRHWE